MKNTAIAPLLIFLMSINSFAGDINIYSTGVDDFMQPLLSGMTDVDYSADYGPAYAVDPQVVANPSGGPRSIWMNPSTLSPLAKWISFSSNPQNVGNKDTYIYQTQFDLTNFNLSDVAISGAMSSSSSSSFYINGNYLFSHFDTIDTHSFRYATNFSIDNSSNFLVQGINTITIEVSNGYPSLMFRPPNGVLMSVTSVPEPSSIAMAGIGLCTILFIINRSKNASR